MSRGENQLPELRMLMSLLEIGAPTWQRHAEQEPTYLKSRTNDNINDDEGEYKEQQIIRKSEQSRRQTKTEKGNESNEKRAAPTRQLIRSHLLQASYHTFRNNQDVTWNKREKENCRLRKTKMCEESVGKVNQAQQVWCWQWQTKEQMTKTLESQTKELDRNESQTMTWNCWRTRTRRITERAETETILTDFLIPVLASFCPAQSFSGFTISFGSSDFLPSICLLVSQTKQQRNFLYGSFCSSHYSCWHPCCTHFLLWVCTDHSVVFCACLFFLAVLAGTLSASRSRYRYDEDWSWRCDSILVEPLPRLLFSFAFPFISVNVSFLFLFADLFNEQGQSMETKMLKIKQLDDAFQQTVWLCFAQLLISFSSSLGWFRIMSSWRNLEVVALEKCGSGLFGFFIIIVFSSTLSHYHFFPCCCIIADFSVVFVGVVGVSLRVNRKTRQQVAIKIIDLGRMQRWYFDHPQWNCGAHTRKKLRAVGFLQVCLCSQIREPRLLLQSIRKKAWHQQQREAKKFSMRGMIRWIASLVGTKQALECLPMCVYLVFTECSSLCLSLLKRLSWLSLVSFFQSVCAFIHLSVFVVSLPPCVVGVPLLARSSGCSWSRWEESHRQREQQRGEREERGKRGYPLIILSISASLSLSCLPICLLSLCSGSASLGTKLWIFMELMTGGSLADTGQRWWWQRWGLCVSEREVRDWFCSWKEERKQ